MYNNNLKKTQKMFVSMCNKPPKNPSSDIISIVDGFSSKRQLKYIKINTESCIKETTERSKSDTKKERDNMFFVFRYEPTQRKNPHCLSTPSYRFHMAFFLLHTKKMTNPKENPHCLKSWQYASHPSDSHMAFFLIHTKNMTNPKENPHCLKGRPYAS